MAKGKKEGKGAQYDAESGSFYYGQWASGKQHGYGIKFFGRTSRLAQQGFDVLRGADDAEVKQVRPKSSVWPMVYKGSWSRGLFNGDGFIKFSNGIIVLGNFKDGHLRDKRDIQVMHPNGDVYCGQHRNLVKSGRGQYIYKDSGDKYIGEWTEDMKEGQGELIFGLFKAKSETGVTIPEDDLKRMKGIFKDDAFLKGRLQDTAGNIFTSEQLPDSFKSQENSRVVLIGD